MTRSNLEKPAIPPTADSPRSSEGNAKPSRRRRRAARKAGPQRGSNVAVPTEQPVITSRPASKSAKILALLKRPDGVGLKELLKTTGWQPHSVRGFLSGVVAKRMGLKVRSTKAGAGERRYRIIP